MSEEALSKELSAYIRPSTFDALEAYVRLRTIGRDAIVDLALRAYLNGHTNSEVDHLRAVIQMQQERINELLLTHDQL